MHDVLKLARLHAESLYELDATGRILRVREPEPEPPPRFALVRTSMGTLSFIRHDVPPAIASRLRVLAENEPPLSDPRAPPLLKDAYVEALNEHTPVVVSYSGPAFALPQGTEFPEGVTRVSKQTGALLERHFPWVNRYFNVYSPICAVVDDGAAVAICSSAREPSAGSEAGVFTVEAYRRRGHGQRVVAAWANALSEEGRLPLYSTWWENAASLRIAESLGGRLYAADFSLR